MNMQPPTRFPRVTIPLTGKTPPLPKPLRVLPMLRTIRQLSIVAVLLCSVVSANAASSPLFARGYTVIPEPQKVELNGKDFVFGNDWHLALTSGVNNGMAAVEILRNDL